MTAAAEVKEEKVAMPTETQTDGCVYPGAHLGKKAQR